MNGSWIEFRSPAKNRRTDEWLAAFEETSIRATLMQIRHSLAVKKRSSIWQYIFSLLGLIIFTTISVILGYIFFTRYYLTLCQ
jgi:hypothetical protein